MNDQNEYRPENDGKQESPKGDFYGSDFREYREPAGEPKENRYTYEAIRPITSERPRTQAYSLTALILGIVSLVCCCLTVVPIICGALAIVFAMISKSHLGYFDTMSLLGLIFGIFGLLLGIAALIAVVFGWFDAFMEGFEQGLGNGGGDNNIGDSF